MTQPKNNKSAKKEKRQAASGWLRWLAWVLAGIGCLLIIGEAGLLWLDQAYAQGVFPGVRIGSAAVAGQRHVQLVERLTAVAQSLEKDGIVFQYQGEEVIVTPSALATDDPDLAVSLIEIEAEATADAAYSFGRKGTFWENTRHRLAALVKGQTVPVQYSLDEERIISILDENFSSLENPAVNASLKYEQGEFVIKPESVGERFDYQSALREAGRAIESLSVGIQTTLVQTEDRPTVTTGDLQPLLIEAEAIVARAPFTLSTPVGEVEVPAAEVAGWFNGERRRGETALIFDLGRLVGFFDDLAEDLDIEPTEGRFEIQAGVVVALSAGAPGRQLDRDATRLAMEQAYIQQGLTTAVAVVTTREPEFAAAAADVLQALELLGTGHSNFSGSPANRRHNIATGAKALHGLVIKAGREFSLAQALGPIEKETGYLPELVIKGNKTIPEYGGGLCQIGTTTFRAAMAASLPVTERRNHSYSVSYYLENGLPGTDATIYPPHPDIRFINDTNGPVLIQARTEGNDLYFDFWGKPDGRSSVRTTPRIWDRVSPPPTREVESPDLAPGVRKCTEKAHVGLKAEFTYTIRYPSGETKEQIFRSTYKPWQEVCLVGV